MRVLDNLENYDIPSGFHLTAEQEEQLAADLKEIVLALIPLRSSKLDPPILQLPSPLYQQRQIRPKPSGCPTGSL